MSDPCHIAFVTIGNSPRDDIVPEMLDEIQAGLPDLSIRVSEVGVLDGLTDSALQHIMARDDEPAFATRCHDGSELTISVQRTERRLIELLQDMDNDGYDLIVVLCTGTHIPKLAKTIVIEAQKVVDHAIDALSIGDGPLGIVLPFERQISEFQERHKYEVAVNYAAASPYDGQQLADRVTSLSTCRATVMHCMGYTRAMRDQLRDALPHPVMNARGFVAAHVRQFL